MWKLALGEKNAEQRAVFVDSLLDVMATDKRVMMLEADLGGASLTTRIQDRYPEQFINVGIAEANMVGVAAGLSSTGWIPFLHTFAPFAARRALDQIFLSGAYARNNIKIHGSAPGICTEVNGGTHASFEDIAALRAIPEVMIFDPADAVQLDWLVRELVDLFGVQYIRTSRKTMPSIYAKGSTFTIGKGNLLRTGSDVLLVAMGEELHPALMAAGQLEKEGIACDVIDIFTIKPLDSELILARAAGKKLVLTAENHSIYGGLGSAVAELLAEQGCGIPLRRIGNYDRFGQVGMPDYQAKDYHLDCDSIIRMVKEAL